MKRTINTVALAALLAVGCSSLPTEQLDNTSNPGNPEAAEASLPPIGTLMAEASALQLKLPTNAPAADHSGHAGHGQPAANKSREHEHKEHAK